MSGTPDYSERSEAPGASTKDEASKDVGAEVGSQETAKTFPAVSVKQLKTRRLQDLSLQCQSSG